MINEHLNYHADKTVLSYQVSFISAILTMQLTTVQHCCCESWYYTELESKLVSLMYLKPTKHIYSFCQLEPQMQQSTENSAINCLALNASPKDTNLANTQSSWQVIYVWKGLNGSNVKAPPQKLQPVAEVISMQSVYTTIIVANSIN